MKNRLSVIFLFTGFVLSLIAFIFGLAVQIPFWMNIFNLAAMFLCLVLPITIPHRLHEATSLALSFVAFVYFPFVYFTNAGNYGSGPLYFVMIMVYFAFYFRGRRLIVILSVLIIYYTIIMVTGYMQPELVIPYPDEISKLIDLCVAVISISVVMSIIASTTFTSYNKEHHRVSGLMKELQDKNKELKLLSVTDQLTGIYNRRYFTKILQEELILSEKSKKQFYLLMIDIDHFKEFNDNYGHLYGDEIIKSVANVIGESIRNHDIVARFGGEEFLVLISHVNEENGHQIAERIRTYIEKIEYRKESSVTVSIGVTKNVPGDSVVDIIKRADDLLYTAKQNGRNRVESNL